MVQSFGKKGFVDKKKTTNLQLLGEKIRNVSKMLVVCTDSTNQTWYFVLGTEGTLLVQIDFLLPKLLIVIINHYWSKT